MSNFMTMVITRKGRLASCECEFCWLTNYWHEWADEGQAEDLKIAQCSGCGRKLNPDTYWESKSRNWYAGRYTAPGYLDCTMWEYETNKRRLEVLLKDLYGG